MTRRWPGVQSTILSPTVNPRACSLHDRRFWRYMSGIRTCTSKNSDHGPYSYQLEPKWLSAQCHVEERVRGGMPVLAGLGGRLELVTICDRAGAWSCLVAGCWRPTEDATGSQNEQRSMARSLCYRVPARATPTHAPRHIVTLGDRHPGGSVKRSAGVRAERGLAVPRRRPHHDRQE
jgi:hypothetical protein